MFKKDFLWGVATAAVQIEGGAFEGGKGLTNWDVIPTIDKATYQGQDTSVGPDHFHHVKEDVKLLKELGVTSYRFSISWARIIPNGTGKINQEGLAFYDNLINLLLENNIEPLVTLFHWDLPYELYKKGGWLNNDSSDWFLEYVKVVANHFKGRVKNYITLNEPQCIIESVGGNIFRGQYSIKDTLQTIHNLLLAHGKAAKYLHSIANVKVGYAPCSISCIPASDSQEDIEAARKAEFEYHRGSTWDITVWSDPVILGDYPHEYYEFYDESTRPNITKEDLKIISEPLDFYCQNIYTGRYIKSDGNGGYIEINAPVGNPLTSMDWDIIPEALYWGPKFLYERYHKPLIITENGCAVTDIVTEDDKVHDGARIEYLKQYIKQFKRACDDGVDGKGYFVWSFMDNFEWSKAYSRRFGLVYINYQTLKRTKKDSFYYYHDVVTSNGEKL